MLLVLPGGRYGGARDLSMYASAEKLVSTAAQYPYPHGTTAHNSVKDGAGEGAHLSNARLDKERERQYMHQQVCHKQQMHIV